MRKSIAIGIIVTLVIGLIAAVPVFAKGQPKSVRVLFEADLINTNGNPHGEVWVRDNPSNTQDWVKVDIEGAAADEDYDLIVFTWDGMATQNLGTFTTDDEGEFSGEFTTLYNDAVYAGVIFYVQESGGGPNLCATGFVTDD
ncbi:hypothetical protein ACFLV0_03240 [Chloroflexota bacterium]